MAAARDLIVNERHDGGVARPAGAMAPLPSLARLSLRPAPVGNGDDEMLLEQLLKKHGDEPRVILAAIYCVQNPRINDRYACEEVGFSKEQAKQKQSNKSVKRLAEQLKDRTDAFLQSLEARAQGVLQSEQTPELEADKKRKAEAEGTFIGLSDGEASQAPKAVRAEGKGEGKQPAELDFQRRNRVTAYTETRRQASEAALSASSALLDDELDNGLAYLAKARDLVERAKYQKDEIDKSGGPPPDDAGEDVETRGGALAILQLGRNGDGPSDVPTRSGASSDLTNRGK